MIGGPSGNWPPNDALAGLGTPEAKSAGATTYRREGLIRSESALMFQRRGPTVLIGFFRLARSSRGAPATSSGAIAIKRIMNLSGCRGSIPNRSKTFAGKSRPELIQPNDGPKSIGRPVHPVALILFRVRPPILGGVSHICQASATSPKVGLSGEWPPKRSSGRPRKARGKGRRGPATSLETGRSERDLSRGFAPIARNPSGAKAHRLRQLDPVPARTIVCRLQQTPPAARPTSTCA